jgi:hypothetical protein
MNTHHLRVAIGLALAAGALPRAHAATAQEHAWGFALFGGDSLSLAGALRGPETAAIEDLGTIDTTLAGSPGSLALDRLHYTDIYNHRYGLGAELDYAFSDRVQGFGRLAYDMQNGRGVAIGTLSSEALPGAARVSADFSDANAWSLDFGARYFVPVRGDWRPYVDGALGATRMDAVTAALSIPDLAVAIPDVRFTRASTVFDQSLEGGVEYAPSASFGLRLGVGADHYDRLRSAGADPTLTELGLDTTHEAGSHWAFPVTLTASYNFG